MDSFSYIATFHNLKVNVSTRMSMVYLKFQARVHVASSTQATVESSCSTPIIVITNESQWCEAKGKLILMDCFGSQVRAFFFASANEYNTNRALLLLLSYTSARNTLATVCQRYP